MHLKVSSYFRELNNSLVVPGKLLFCPDRRGTKNARNLAEQDAAALLNVNCFVYFVNLTLKGWLLVLLQSSLKTGSVLDVYDAMLALLSLGQVQCCLCTHYTLSRAHPGSIVQFFPEKFNQRRLFVRILSLYKSFKKTLDLNHTKTISILWLKIKWIFLKAK